jgi:hypothetical protein
MYEPFVNYDCDSLSQLGALRLLLAPIPSSEYDVERATWTSLHGSRNGRALETEEVGVPYICRRDDPVLMDN